MGEWEKDRESRVGLVSAIGYYGMEREYGWVRRFSNYMSIWLDVYVFICLSISNGYTLPYVHDKVVFFCMFFGGFRGERVGQGRRLSVRVPRTYGGDFLVRVPTYGTSILSFPFPFPCDTNQQPCINIPSSSPRLLLDIVMIDLARFLFLPRYPAAFFSPSFPSSFVRAAVHSCRVSL